ncbi:unnamed protein product [Arctia plantaginis]|uniref:Pro-resilin-like n=1 Tax=Arctia plantaginis TaxID=874455 RepID=A0A8S1BCQ0_ARCPL|nr:unnamed protein product [Arctia plantaginis]
MLHFKVFIICLIAAAVTCEPPIQGYNYQQPALNSYNSPTNSYIPPSTGFSPPSNNYLPPTFSSGNQNSYNHGQHSHHGHGHGHDNEVPKSYEFGYSVKDAQSGNDYDRKESSDGNVVRGEYRVQLPDGRTQIVTYHADWQTGFHADVRYEGQAKYPEPTYNNRRQGGYNYNAPQDFSGSLTGFNNNNNYKQPSTAYGPPGYQ